MTDIHRLRARRDALDKEVGDLAGTFLPEEDQLRLRAICEELDDVEAQLLPLELAEMHQGVAKSARRWNLGE